MRYKWVTYADKTKQFYKWKLLPEDRIPVWKENLMKQGKYHIFSTIQSFDIDGASPECPIIYADFDGPNALTDARILYARTKRMLGSAPNVFFSGKKGFHIIFPCYISYPKCSEIARIITKQIGGFDTLDKGRYGTRIMFREDGTIHPDTGFYKRQLTEEQLFERTLEEIKELAKLTVNYNSTVVNLNSTMQTLIDLAVLELESKQVQINGNTSSIMDDMLPCIEGLIRSEIPQGEKHYTIFLLARYFRSRGYSEGSACMEIQRNETLSQHIRHVEEVVHSVYDSRDTSNFGCKDDSLYSEILRRHCSKLCKFNKEDLL